jgi:hypothetical protein
MRERVSRVEAIAREWNRRAERWRAVSWTRPLDVALRLGGTTMANQLDSQQVLGAITVAPVGVDASPLWPDAEQDSDGVWAHYVNLCRLAGAAPSTERPTLLAIRGVELRLPSTHVVRSVAALDDAFVLLTPGQAPSTREFAGATHPYQTTSTESPNGAVAMIRPGVYALTPVVYKGYKAMRLLPLDGVDRVPAYRDLNHDGLYSPDEIRASVEATSGLQVAAGIGMYANEVFLHPGAAWGFSSIGCLTAAAADVAYVNGLGRVDLVLADATALLEAIGGGGANA